MLATKHRVPHYLQSGPVVPNIHSSVILPRMEVFVSVVESPKNVIGKSINTITVLST